MPNPKYSYPSQTHHGIIQPHPTYSYKNSLRNRSHPRKQHQALQQTTKSLQPRSPTITTSPKSKSQKNLATRFKELRKTPLDVYSVHAMKSVQQIAIILYTSQYIDL
jgi:hypothetical protein